MLEKNTFRCHPPLVMKVSKDEKPFNKARVDCLLIGLMMEIQGPGFAKKLLKDREKAAKEVQSMIA